ncbi:claudin-34 [Dromiciops gliroides]|uniref:claudin-34 n=1 Tax=Dromiciops gliroides TaxID=33562 RepID=UPI001CC46FF6|nr:claudin-34 [Dromiciops gliroides]
MSSCLSTGNLQLSGFALATSGWILAPTSMGQTDWRVWHLDNTTSIISSGIAWVGIWKVCFYNTILLSPQGRSVKICHTYGMFNSLLSQDFRAVQNIFLFACILGVLGKVSIILALRNFYMGAARRSTTCNLFTIGGFFYLFAGICILICVIWNFYAVSKNESLTFPATFYLPPRPKTQEVGNAVSMAITSAILMLLGGGIFLFCKFHRECQVYPLIRDINF